MSIWEYNSIVKNINALNLITLEEGNTPIDTLNLDGNKLFIKREDKNPTGSWKDRGTAYKITELVKNNIFGIVIASSGNAAISFLNYAKEVPNFKLHVVISPNINSEKKKIIEELAYSNGHKVYIDAKAKHKAVKVASETGLPLLKSSTDSSLTKGYWSLGFELAKIMRQNRNKKHMLLAPVSSGTSLVGLTEGLFLKLEQENLMPEIIACQTQSVHPLLEEEPVVEGSLADAIVDKSLLRKPQLLKLLDETRGRALAIDNNELLNAKEFIKSKGIEDLSDTSLLSIAGFLRMKSDTENYNYICIASGR